MAITNRRRLHLPNLEALEDRFLPSVTSILSLASTDNQACVTDAAIHSTDLDKDVKTSSTSITTLEQGRIADAAFESDHANLSQMLAYKPLFAVITYQPMTMQFHETIWFAYVPLKPVLSMVKSKVSAPGNVSSDSDDLGGVARNIVLQNVASALAGRPRVAGVDVLAKDIVDNAVAVSTSRTMENASNANLPLTNIPLGSANIALPNFSSTLPMPQGGQGSAIRPDSQSNDNQDGVPATLPETTRGVVASPDSVGLSALSNRLTEKQGLLTDESTLILNEIEQALQTLVEPITASLQSYEPSVLWVFLSTWIAAAGITYEYLRRKSQLDQLSMDVWKEWRSLPLHRES